MSYGLVTLTEDENAKVEVTGPGFIWDKFGHVATNYHAVAKLATDRSRFTALYFYLMLEAIAWTGKARSLVLFHKADVEGYELKPVALATSRELLVDQSCFAIENPY